MNAQELLQEIADYCRNTGLAESTFGRRAVNDGKLTARLRNGGPPFDHLARLSAWYRRLAERPSIAPVVKEIAEADAALSHPVARRAN